MCARSSSFDVSIAIISGLKKIDMEVNIEASEAIAKSMYVDVVSVVITRPNIMIAALR